MSFDIHPFTLSWVEQALGNLYSKTFDGLLLHAIAMFNFAIQQLSNIAAIGGALPMLGELTASDLEAFTLFTLGLLLYPLFLGVLLTLYSLTFLLVFTFVFSVVEKLLRSVRWVFVGKEGFCKEVVPHMWKSEGQTLVDDGKEKEEQGRYFIEQGGAWVNKGEKLAEEGREMVARGEVLLDQMEKQEEDGVSEAVDGDKLDERIGFWEAERRRVMRIWVSEA